MLLGLNKSFWIQVIIGSVNTGDIMCGINGYYDFTNKIIKNDLLTIVHKMNNRIIYRGPDGEGVYAENSFAMGMRRLSIIDLAAGNQPIFNEDKTLAIVFNGEIYNFKELRYALECKGHKFATASDTEVIIHLYEEEGYECLKKLDGMFAFAIFDKSSGEVFIGRDKCGEKPLYYYIDNEKFTFASELKSMIEIKAFDKKISKVGLEFYLKFSYIPAPYTIFENVSKLEAGYYIVVEANGKIEKQRYWDMQLDDNKLINDYEKCVIALKSTLRASINSRMVSDVPIGCFLSGGIDSTIITGIMSELSDRPVEAFTIGFADKEYDETDRAIIAARQFGCNHHIEILSPIKMLECAHKVIAGMDEPFADPAAIPTYFLSQMAAKYVKVILTGESGDELFAGYSKYLVCYYSNMYNKIPNFLRTKVIRKMLNRLPKQSTIYRKLYKVINNSEKGVFQQRLALMQVSADDETYNKVVNPHYQTNETGKIVFELYNKYISNTQSEVSRTLYTDFKILLEGCMFPKVDRVSMLNSIETRTPMVSAEMLRLCSCIPSDFKMRDNTQKIILKDAFKSIIPEKLLYKSKRGFAVPIGKWFKAELKDELEKTLKNTSKMHSIFNQEIVDKLFNEHINDKKDNTQILWSLYLFQKWYEKLN